MIAAIADIHGNLPALEAVLDDMPKVDEIWVLGDYATGAPYPCEVFDRLFGLSAPLRCILGNHDETLLAQRGTKYGKQFGIFGWVQDCLKPHHWDFLESLPKTLDVDGLALLFHGKPEMTDGLIITRQDAETVAKSCGHKWLAGGHRHRFMVFRLRDRRLFIPGSVGISIDSIGGMASYALLCKDTGRLTFRQVSYDVDSVTTAIDKSPLVELAPGFSKSVKKELLTGRLYAMSLVKFGFDYAEKQLGFRPDEIPHDLWDEAEMLWDESPLPMF